MDELTKEILKIKKERQNYKEPPECGEVELTGEQTQIYYKGEGHGR